MIDPEAVTEAIANAVRSRLPKMSGQEFLDAVREGVCDAVSAAIRNATDMPTADFFQSVKDGVREAMLELEERT